MKTKVIAFLMAILAIASLTGCDGIEDVPALIATKILGMYDEETSATESATVLDNTGAETTRTEETHTDSVQTEPETEETTQAEADRTAVAAALPFTVEDQIALILAQRELWGSYDDMNYSFNCYTVTDLDFNGRMEVLCGACVGTGFFTYMGIWEVNEDCTALVAVKSDYAEDESQLDLICNEAKVFYDPRENTYTYIFSDYARGGWMWNGTTVSALRLADGFVNTDYLCSHSCETDEEYVSHDSYYGTDGSEITAEEYETLPDRMFADLQALQAKFRWRRLSSDDEQVAAGGNMSAFIREAWEGFSVE